MQEIPQLLLHNRAWAAEQLEEDPEFFRRTAGATEIEGSTPGVYRGMLKP